MTDGGLTPSQTVGPFLHIALAWADGSDVVPEGTPGSFLITGTVRDGAGKPVPDALVETWQADPGGGFAHPDAAGAVPPGARSEAGGTATPGFRGFGRCPTGPDGGYAIRTVKPGRPAGDATAAPHIDVSVFARGLLDRLVTRAYFGDEPEANAADTVLGALPDARRATLIAAVSTDGYRFDICLQGDGETVFFDV
jgi:protocatechuate 3,4-dioxygenase, alpha subunit